MNQNGEAMNNAANRGQNSQAGNTQDRSEQMYNTMNQGAMGQPGQPVMMQSQPKKPPMDPRRKKKLIMGIVLGVVGLVVVIIAAIVLSVVLRVDYGEAYRTAKELEPEIYDLSNSSDCQSVTDYVKSASTSIEYYNKYVEACRAMGDGTDELATKLGETAGVKRDAEIKAQFDRFKEGLDAVLPNQEELNQKLDLYQAWHTFVVLLDDLSLKNADSEFQTAANALINSGNEQLKVYGEGWLEKAKIAAHSYQEWDRASWSAPNYNDLNQKRKDDQSALQSWVSANRPDILSVAELKFDNASKVYNEFTKLYDMISTKYEENYNSESGDCYEFLGEVECD